MLIQLKHGIGRKAFPIPFCGFIQTFSNLQNNIIVMRKIQAGDKKSSISELVPGTAEMELFRMPERLNQQIQRAFESASFWSSSA